MSGFRELFQSAVQRHDRRGRRADVDDAGPLFAIRVRPIREARARWANVAGSRLGYDCAGNRVEFVTEPKTGLKLPGALPRRTSHRRAPRTPPPLVHPPNPRASDASDADSLSPRAPSPTALLRSLLPPPPSFPDHPPSGEYCVRGKTSGCAPLTGMGVRVKRIAGIGVKVYACGLYVDPSAARAAVGDRYVGRKVSDVAKDQSLYAAVMNDAKVEKTVRLVFARDLDSAKIADALSERLRPALGAGSASLREFESHFEGVQFKKGQSLTFSAVGGKLHTSIQGKEVGAIADPKLCVALFDAYLGKNPVVPGAKQSLGEQLASHVTG